MVNISSKDVRVVLLKGERLNIIYKNADKKDFLYENKDGIYKIKQVKKTKFNNWKNWMSGFPTIEVYIPKETRTVIVNADANEIVANGLILDLFEAKVLNGKITVSNTSSKNMKLQCVNGTCDCKNVKVIDMLDMKTMNGKSTLAASITKDCGYDIGCKNGSTVFLGEKVISPLHKEGTPFYKVHCSNGITCIKQ